MKATRNRVKPDIALDIFSPLIPNVVNEINKIFPNTVRAYERKGTHLSCQQANKPLHQERDIFGISSLVVLNKLRKGTFKDVMQEVKRHRPLMLVIGDILKSTLEQWNGWIVGHKSISCDFNLNLLSLVEDRAILFPKFTKKDWKFAEGSPREQLMNQYSYDSISSIHRKERGSFSIHKVATSCILRHIQELKDRINKMRLSGKHILLIDDSFGSGTTMSWMLRMLIHYGIDTSRIHCLALINERYGKPI